MKTLEEKNRMIAEFMGHEEEQTESGEFVYAIEFQNPEKLNDIQVEFFCAHEFKYHISWDWLMPVVEKIESFEGTHGNNYKFTIQNETSYIDCTNIISSPSVKSKIESTYETVFRFIEFYNEQK
jgi:hypothetical protein